jgi:F-box/TPR repeat protein Pof3
LRSHLPHLEYMVLRDVQGLSEEWLEALLDKWEDESGILHTFSAEDEAGATPLQHLWLGGLLHEHTPESLFSETGLLSGPRILTPALQSLSINGLPCTDKDVEMLINHPVALQTLDISSTKVSGASLKMLADSLSTLQYLKADNCTRISSRDAVVYAEKRGVTVSCMMTDPLGGRGGKKVRYG